MDSINAKIFEWLGYCPYECCNLRYCLKDGITPCDDFIQSYCEVKHPDKCSYRYERPGIPDYLHNVALAIEAAENMGLFFEISRKEEGSYVRVRKHCGLWKNVDVPRNDPKEFPIAFCSAIVRAKEEK